MVNIKQVYDQFIMQLYQDVNMKASFFNIHWYEQELEIVFDLPQALTNIRTLKVMSLSYVSNLNHTPHC